MSAPTAKHDPTEQVVGCVLLLVMLPCQIAWHLLISGYTLARLWAWFIVPLFDARLLTIAQAAGLMLVVWFVTVKHETPKHDDSALETAKKQFGRSVWATTYAVLVLGEGYILHRILT